MINSSCFPAEGTIFEQLAAECVRVCLYIQVGNVLLCNEEAVLRLIFKDDLTR